MENPVPLGVWKPRTLIPPVLENCISIEAGPIRFVIEDRQLTEPVVAPYRSEVWHKEDEFSFDDLGATLHVLGAGDGLEHLRFDCFEESPHYHYLRHSQGGNLLCRLDQIAEGDPIDWMLGRLRSRLPDMLDFAGVPELADATRREFETVLTAIDRVAELMNEARHKAYAVRAAREASAV